jgi:adenosine kinase
MSSTKLFAFGNPLLDISAEVKPELLAKYNLKADNAILAEAGVHEPLFASLVADYPVEYVPGGSALNTARVTQFFSLPSPTSKGTVSYMGAASDDKFGATLREKAEGEGLNVELALDTSKSTGKCAALVTGGKRSLVADLQAAESFSAVRGDTKSVDTVLGGAKKWFEEAGVFYTTSFVLTHSAEAATTLAAECARTNKTFVMNLSAPFLLEVPPFFASVKGLLPYADYVFCNDSEAASLIKAMGWPEGDLEGAATKLATYEKVNKAQERTVIFTCGGSPAIVAKGAAPIAKYAPITLAPGQLVDENGAGDAYLGGFLAALVDGKSTEECFALAAYAAYVVIQQHGCKLVNPEELPTITHDKVAFPPAHVVAAKRQKV